MLENVYLMGERGLAQDPGAVADIAHAVRSASVSAADFVDASIARIEEAEPQVAAWRELDFAAARSAATDLSPVPNMPLAGVPVAIKDIVDVAGFPTRAGSGTREHASPATADAEIVRALRTAGAIVIGKAHTTEFALFDGPPPTRNPHNLHCTPGGSSAGPAAAVASGMVPAAIGTQTAASLSRPAAYCGIGAFKPTMLSTVTAGVVPIAHSLDTIGYYGFRLADAVAVFRAVSPPAFAQTKVGTPFPQRVLALDDPLFSDASAAVSGAVGKARDLLTGAGVAIESLDSPVGLESLLAIHKTISEFELARTHGAVLRAPEAQSTEGLRAALERGLAIPEKSYLDARRNLATQRAAFWGAIGEDDILLTPPVPETAPEGMATGDPRFIIPLNILGGPIASVPTGLDADRMPLGVMLCGYPGADGRVADAVVALADVIEVPR